MSGFVRLIEIVALSRRSLIHPPWFLLFVWFRSREVLKVEVIGVLLVRCSRLITAAAAARLACPIRTSVLTQQEVADVLAGTASLAMAVVSNKKVTMGLSSSNQLAAARIKAITVTAKALE